MSTPIQPLEILREAYDDIELAILFDWLEIERPQPLVHIDPEASIQPDRRVEAASPGPVRLLESYDGFDYERRTRLANAVARIALNAIADRLPQWAVHYGDGRWEFGRDAQPRRPAAIEPVPRFLLMINWADSAPGISWPESYHATQLPGLGRIVVTLSADSPDAHGYTDIAIGHFPAEADFDAEVERILCAHWHEQTAGEPMCAWEYVFDEGHVTFEAAYAWRARIWGIGWDNEPIGDDDEEELEEEETDAQ